MTRREARADSLLTGIRRRDRASLLRSTALQAAVLTVLIAPAALAQPAPNAHPTGGSVVAGTAQISQTANSTVITQSTNRAALDWKSFNVGSQQSVDFVQPSTSAMTLNRVTGSDPSAIAGQIHANGGVVLTNPNGVVFYKGSQVNAQNVIVSTAGITNQNFMAGHMVFDQAGKPNAGITNAGTITVKETGLAALVAPQVANSGLISAKLGHVVLAGAQAATLDMYGDGLLSVDVTKQVTQAPLGPDGKPVTALVTNTGVIAANGGQVVMTASAADGVVQNLVSAGGKIHANSVGDKTGSIAINGVGGSIVISGELTAAGHAAGTTGGNIELNASGSVLVGPTARVNASGSAGGGTVAVGTTLLRAKGGPSVTPAMTAATTTIAHGARITANATKTGNGGQVTVLSTQNTFLRGSISAKGGSISGNGGTVEVSTGGVVALGGDVDVSAPHGSLGVILLDPGTLDITNARSNTTIGGSGTVGYSQGGTIGISYIYPSQLNNLTGNIRLQAASDINVQSAISRVNTGAFELDAGGNLVVSAPITTRGALTLIAGSSLGSTPTLAGSLTVNAALNSGGYGISLQGGAGGIALNANVVVGDPRTYSTLGNRITLTTSGPITQSAGTGLTAYYLNVNAGSAALTGDNDVKFLSAYTSIGNFSFRQSPAGTLAGTIDLQNNAIRVPDGQTIALAIDGIRTSPDGSLLTAPDGTVSIVSATAGRPIALVGTQATTAGTLSLSQNYLIRYVNAGTLSIGSSTNGGPISVAPSESDGITFTGKLVLNSSSLVTQGLGTLQVGSLAGTAQGITLANTSNIIPAVGDIIITGPTAAATSTFTLATSGSLSVTGPIAGAAGIELSPGGNLYLGGNLNAATVALYSGGAISQTAGTIGATLLTGNASYTVTLGQANQVGTLGAFRAGGDFTLFNAAPLTVDGYVFTENEGSTNIRLQSTGAITIASGGSLVTAYREGGITLTSSTALSIASGGYLASGGVYLYSGGAIFETGASGIRADVLRGTATSAALIGTSNDIGNLGDFTIQTGGLGNFTLVNFGAMNVGGTVSVPTGGQIVLVDNALTFTTGSSVAGGNAALIAPGGGVTLAPVAANFGLEVINSGTTGNNVLTLTQADLNVIQAGTGTLTLGLPTTTAINLGNLITAGSIDSVNLTGIANTLNLQTSGAVTQGHLTTYGAVAGGLTVNNLIGSAASVLLPATNNISNLSGITVSGNFGLADAAPLTVSNFISAGSTINLELSNANVALSGTINAPNVDIFELTGNAITQLNGGIITNTLSAAGSDVTLNAAGNTIFALGSVAASAGNVTVLNQGQIATSTVRATGNVLVEASGSILASGLISAGATSSLTLISPGKITEIAGATMSAGTLTGSASSAAFLGTNTIATLGSFAATDPTVGSFTLANTGALTVAGPVTATQGITFDVANNLTLSGIVSAPTVVLDPPGAITQPGGGVTATALSATGTSITLDGANNTITSAVSLVATAGDVTLVNQGPLSISGNGVVASANVLLNTTGSLKLDGTVQTGATNTLSLIASGNTVSDTANAQVTAGTLTGSAATAQLLQGETIATLGNFTATVSDLTLVDSRALAVVGTVTSPTTVQLSAAGLLTSAGTIAGNTVVLTNPAVAGQGIQQTAGRITGTAGITLTAGNLGIVQTGGSLTGGTLAMYSAGSIALPSHGNALTNLGSTTVAYGLALYNSQALTVSGPVSNTQTNAVAIDAAGSLVIGAAIGSTSGITLTATGAITEPAGGALTTDVLSVSGASVALGQTANAVTYLTSGQATTGGFAFTDGSPLTVPGSVSAATGTALVLNADTIALRSSTSLSVPGGTISLAAPNTTDAFTLTNPDTVSSAFAAATVVIGATANNAVRIDGVFDFSPAGTLALLSGAAGLAISETPTSRLTATSLVGNSAGTVSLTGTNTIPALGSFSSIGGFTLSETGVLTVNGPVTDTQNVLLTVGSNVTLAGSIGAPLVTVNAGTFSITQTAGDVDGSTGIHLTGGGGITQTGGSLTGGELFAYAANGGVQLNRPGNALTSLGTVATSSGFSLYNAQGLNVLGPVSNSTSGRVALNTTGSLSLGGSIGSPTGIFLTATGAVTEPAGGVLSTTSLSVSGSSVDLGQIANAIGTVTLGSATAGTFALTDGTALTVAGNITVPVGSTLTLADDALGFAGTPTLSALAGTVVLAPATAGDPIGLDGIGIGHVAAGTLVVGATDAGAINIAATLDFSSVSVLDLLSGGTIGETFTSGLIAGTLTGSAASLALIGTANNIATLGSFTTTSGFNFRDGTSLTVDGPVTDRTSIELDTGGNLTLAGALAAPVMLLSAPGFAITQTGGGVTTGTLSGSAGGIALGGTANLIGRTDFLSTSTGDIYLVNQQPLTIGGSGAFSAGNLTLSTPGTLAGLVLDGAVGVNNTNRLTLLAGSGTVTDTANAAVVVGTLTGDGASVRLVNGESISVLGSFATTGGFTLTDNSVLTVAGPVTDSAGVLVSAIATLALSGAITAPVVEFDTNAAGGISQTTGSVNASTGITLRAGTGGIVQTGGSLTGGSLTIASQGSVALPDHGNSLAVLTGVSAATGFGLYDARALSVTGSVVNSANALSLSALGTLSIGAGINSPGGITLAATGAITEPAGGVLATNTLSISGSTITLGQTANAIGTIVAGSATAGTFALTDSEALTVAGNITVPSGSTLTLADDSLGFAGTPTLSALAGTVVLAPATAGDPITLGTGGVGHVAANTLVIGATDAGSIRIAGVLDFTSVAVLDLLSGGTISESADAGLRAGTLTGSAARVLLTSAGNTIAALGSFTTTSGFDFRDGTSLAVDGPVTDQAHIALTIDGNLTLAGALSAPAVSLYATGFAITQTGGGITTAGLTANANSVILGGAGNTVSATDFLNAAAGDITLVNQGGLSVSGSGAIASGNILLGATGNLVLDSVVQTGTTSILTLRAPGAAVSDTANATITAGTLTGAAGTLALTNADTFATLGAFASTTGFNLVDGGALTIAGPVSDGAHVSITSVAGFTVAGDITAPNIVLSASTVGGFTQTAGNIDGSSGIYLHTARGGSIVQTGGSLTGGQLSANTAGYVSLPDQGNALTAIGNIAAGQGVTLVNGVGLDVVGAVRNADGELSLTVGGSLAIGASLASHGEIFITATGAITEPAGGVLATYTMGVTGSSVNLGQIANAVGTLVASGATAGNFAFTDGQALAIGATVAVPTGATLTLNNDSLSFFSGALLSAPNGTVVLAPATAGDPIALGSTGVANIAAGTLVVGALDAGSISIAGTLDFASVTELDLLSGAAITESADAGLIANTLSGSAASANLTGSANTIAALGSFSTTGGFSLKDNAALTVTGPVTDGSTIALTIANNLTLGGALAAPTVSLYATGFAITQTGGGITTSALTASANAITLDGPANAVGTTAGLDAATGGVTLVNQAPLTIGGTGVTAAGDVLFSTPGASAGIQLNAPITTGATSTLALLAGAGTIGDSVGAQISAGTLTGNGLSVVLVNPDAGGGFVGEAIDTLGSFTSTNGLTLVNIGSLVVAGPVTDATKIQIAVQVTDPGSMFLTGTVSAPVVSLSATGAIVQSGGEINGATAIYLTATGGDIVQTGGSLTGGVLNASSTNGGVSLPGAGNELAALGSGSSAAGFTLTDGQSLNVTGGVSNTIAGVVALSATGSLSVGAAINSPGGITLTATGAVTEPVGGTLTTGTLSVAGASVTLGQSANAIGTIIAGSATLGAFALTDADPLTVAGTIAVATGSTLTLNNDALGFAAGALLSAPSGTVVLAPATAGDPIALGSAGIGHVTASTLVVGAADAGSITIGGMLDFASVDQLDLLSGDAIRETTGGGLIAGTLAGSALSVSLTGANTIAALGSFATTGGFSLTDAAALGVDGPLTDHTKIALTTGGNLTLGGTVFAPVVSLYATGFAITQIGGGVTTSALTASANGITLDGPANAVTATELLNAATGGVTLVNQARLTIQGTGVTAAGDVLLSTPGTLAGIYLNAPVTTGATGTLTLLAGTGAASAGDSTQITAGTLTGAALSLYLGKASIATLGSFTSSTGFTLTNHLTNNAPLVVAGPIVDGNGIIINTVGTEPISVTGTLSAPTIHLLGGGTILQSGGNINASSVVYLMSLTGDIVQTGGSLTGGALVARSESGLVSLPSYGNAIARLTDSSSTGGFTLNNGRSLLVGGTLNNSTSGVVALGVIGDIYLDSAMYSPGAIRLTATGSIAGPESFTTGTLSVIGASVSLVGTGSSVGTLIASGATLGAFSFTDDIPLTVAGTISVPTGSTLTLNNDSLGFASGALLSAPSGTVVLAPATAGDPIALGSVGVGHVSAGTLVVGATNAGSITIGGSLDFAAVSQLDLLSGAAITETAGGGLTAGTLSGSGLSLALTGTNTIAALGSFATTAGFALADTAPLVVIGPVSDGQQISLAIANNLTLAGGLAAPTVSLYAPGFAITQTAGGIGTASLNAAAGSIALTGPANTITATGSLNVTGSLVLADQVGLTLGGSGLVATDALISTPGDIIVAALVAPSNSLTIAAGGTLGEIAGGTIATPLLTGSAGTARLVNGNAIDTLGSFTSGTGFTLVNAAPLVVSGPLLDGVSIALTSTGSTSLAGDVTAPVVQVTSLPGQSVGVGVRGSDPIIAIIEQTAGSIDAATSLSLNAAGAITQNGGSLVTGLLAASAGGTIALPGPGNRVAALGSVSSVGGFFLNDDIGLSVTGPVADTVAIAIATQGSLAVGGILGAPAVSLAATGAITEPGGLITATTLSGSGLSVALGAGNSIANLGSFASGGSFVLGDAVALDVTGRVTAAGNLVLSADAISLAPTASLVATGGSLAFGPLAATDAFSLASTGTTSPTLIGDNAVIGATSGAITLSGPLDFTGAQGLDFAGGSTITQTGSFGITAPVLTGSGSGVVLLTGPNNFGTLGGFTVTGSLAVTNATNLAVGGTVSGPSVSLTATSGSITEPGGAIRAGTLAASAAAVTLDGPSNTIGALGLVQATTGDLVLVDSSGLTVSGNVTAKGSVGLTIAGDLAIAGGIGGELVTLNVAGRVSEPGGTITAAALAGTAGAAALTGSNAVGTLDQFASSGGFTLVNGGALTVAGPVTDATAILLSSTGSLGLAGNVTAPVVQLVAQGPTTDLAAGLIVQSAGSVDAATSLRLTASGAISQTSGSLISGDLVAAAGGTIALPGTGNAVATIGSLSSVGGVSLFDASSVAVAGPVTDDTRIALATGGSLAIGGTLTAPAVALTAAGGITETTGAIDATTLTGQGGGAVSLAQANAIGTLAGFVSGGSLVVTDTRPLTVAGTVSVANGSTLTLNDDSLGFAAGALLSAPSGTVVLAPATTGDAIALGSTGIGHVAANALVVGAADAGSLTVAGTLDFSSVPTLDLLSGVGIGESGTAGLIAGTLSAAAPTISLDGSANTIAALGNIAATGSFTFIDQGNLAVTGPLSAGAIALDATGALGLAGAISAPTVALGAGGGITQTGGSLTAGLLSGSAGGAVSLTGIDTVGTLGGFTSGGGFTLTDRQSLAVTGPVRDTAAITLGVTGSLTLDGALAAPTVSLTATGGIAQDGGTIAATTLTGSSGAGASFAQANAIGTLSGFASGGNLVVTDTQSLTIAGTVSAASGATLTLNDDNLGFAAGALLSAPSGTVVLAPATAGDAIALGSTGIGHVNATTLVVGAADAGSLTIGGTLDFTSVPTLDLLSGVGIGEGSAAGLIAGTLAATAPTISLTGSANTIAALGNIAATGSFSLVDQGSLAVTGLVSAAAIALDTTGAITQTGGSLTAGLLSGSAGGPVSLTGADRVGTLGGFTSSGGFALTDGESLAVTGPVRDTTAITLAVTGSLTLGGALAAPTVDLTATGGIAQSGGAITATTLEGSSGAGASFAQANAIGTLAGFASGGSLVVTDTQALTVAGTVAVASGATLTLNDDAPAFAAAALLSAPGGTVVLAPATAGDAIALSSIGTGHVTANTLVVGATDAGSLTIGGTFDFRSVGTLDLLSGAGIGETAGGALIADTLTGSAASVALTGANTIATLGSFASTGAFALTDAIDLAIAGPLTAASVTLSVPGHAITEPGSISAGSLTATAGSIGLGGQNTIGSLGSLIATTGGVTFADATGVTLAGPVSGTAVTLAVGGTLAEAAGATITATSLAGSASAVTLNGANTIATLGSFASTGAFALNDAIDLAIDGPLTAASVTLSVPGHAITEPGSISAGSLAATAGSIGLGGQNTIGSLGSLIATTGGVTFADATGVTLAGPVSGSAVTLAVGGTLAEAAGATITATSLAGSASAVTLNGANTIAILGSFASTGAFALTDAIDLAIDGPLTAASVTLSVPGHAITEPGSISAGSLTATAGSITLGGQNTIATTGSLTATAGGITLADTTGVALGGPVSGNSVTLNVAGAVSQAAGATVTAGTLSATAASVDLTGVGNSVAQLGTIATTGSFALVDQGNLAIAGPASGGTSVEFATTGTLTLAANITAPVVELGAGAAVAQTGGTLAAGVLFGAISGPVALTGIDAIGTLGPFTSTGGFALNDTQSLHVTGPVTDSVAIAFGVAGSLTLAGSLTAPTVTLTASGSVDQVTGIITATTLGGSDGSGASLTLANQIGTLGDFAGSGGFALTDAQSWWWRARSATAPPWR